MTAHAHRAHARWSASATARNWACPGALTLAEQVTTPERENTAAAWGTACHEVAEQCLRETKNPAIFIGTRIQTKQHEIEVNEEMAQCAQDYIDYVRERAEYGKHKLLLETNFSLAKLNPPFEAGGTCDAIVYREPEKLLEVIDLKTGRGVVVEVEANKQLRTYALGAVLATPGLDVERVMVTIVQPRIDHRDGRIRSETFHVVDLLEWTTDLLDAMKRSHEAMAQHKHVSPMTWAERWLTAGDHCQFCPARAMCPTLEQRALDAAGVWFDDMDKPRVNQPQELSPERLAMKLDMLDMIQEWANAVRSYAHALAESGVEIPGYILVDKIGHRRWKDETEVRTKLFVEADLTDDEVYEKKLKSPAQIEKVLGAKRKHLIQDLIDRPVTGTNLVRADKTTRPAAKPSVHKHLTPIED